MASPHSLLLTVGSLHLSLFRKPSQKNSHPSCVSGFCQISAFTLSVSELSACQAVQHSHVLSPARLGFKNPNFRDPPQQHGPTLILWGRVALPWPGTGLSHKIIVPEHQLGIYGKACSKKPAPRLAALSQSPCSYAIEWDSLMASAGSFVPREAMPPLPNALPRRGTVFTHVT